MGVKTLQIETRDELERRNGRTKKYPRLGGKCDAHGPNGRRILGKEGWKHDLAPGRVV